MGRKIIQQYMSVAYRVVLLDIICSARLLEYASNYMSFFYSDPRRLSHVKTYIRLFLWNFAEYIISYTRSKLVLLLHGECFNYKNIGVNKTSLNSYQ